MQAHVIRRCDQARRGPPCGEELLTDNPSPDHFYNLVHSSASVSNYPPLTVDNASLPPPSARRVHLFDILPPTLVTELKTAGVDLIGPLAPADAALRPALNVADGHYLPIILLSGGRSSDCLR